MNQNNVNPNIIDYYGMFTSNDNNVCLAFPKYGPSLYNILCKQYKFDLKNIAYIAYQIANGLQFLHETANMIHADIKSPNILHNACVDMIKPTYIFDNIASISICDFGSCVSKKSNVGLVQTKYYRALEVICDLKWNEKIDIWSSGCILYELYTNNFMVGDVSSVGEHLLKLCELLGPIPSILLNGKQIQHQINLIEYMQHMLQFIDQMIEVQLTYVLIYVGHFIELDNQCINDQCINMYIELIDDYIELTKKIMDIFTHLFINQQKPIEYVIKDVLLCDLIKKMLDYNPASRISAREIKEHPFITNNLVFD